MATLDGYRIVELSAVLEGQVYRLDTSVDPGGRDVYDLPWFLEDQVNPKDSTIEQLLGNESSDPSWPIPPSGHHGSHIQLGVGHNDNWSGLPDGMLGLWDMPLNTYWGEAAVCFFDDLKGQPILPEHLGNVREGDIVLMGSPHAGEDAPWIDGDTAYWLAEEKKIKMLAVGVPGIGWETKMDTPEPDNCPTHRAMTGNNIPIAYPLTNIETLTQDRVFFMSMPLNVERMEGTWIRAIAIEDA